VAGGQRGDPRRHPRRHGRSGRLRRHARTSLVPPPGGRPGRALRRVGRRRCRRSGSPPAKRRRSRTGPA
jgi:hypothetical protein